MGMYKCQQQRPDNILCPFQYTSVFKENFRPGKPVGFKTTKGILNSGWAFLGLGEGQCLESNGKGALRALQVSETN